ncbi:MAG: TRAP transporter permease [Eubacteriales bacterium]
MKIEDNQDDIHAQSTETTTQEASGSESTEPIDQNELDSIMKKYDREANIRPFEGIPKLINQGALVGFALFMFYMNLYTNWGEQIRHCLFLGMVILLVFANYPRRKGTIQKVNHIPIYDIILALAGSFSYFYYVLNYDDVIKQASRIGLGWNVYVILGIIGIVVLAEACRRVAGLPIIIVASCFIGYAVYTGRPVTRIVYDLFYTTQGVIGTPVKVCASFIVLFIIFGAFLEATGISNFFISCANAGAGASAGGPAKVAVISSALCGMVSGSSVGNTVTTGSITIPLMKKSGYPPEFSGAVEASSSTGGQIMPPIMGAAAFLMAEMCGVEYSVIIQKAILPAFLYFLGIFLMVHFKAKKLNLLGIPKEELPKIKELLPKIYLLSPLVFLVYMIVVVNSTMSRAASYATLLAIAVSMINKENRMTIKTFFKALENGGRNTLSVAAACGMAGVIAGVVSSTGLGQTLISAVVSVAGNNLIIALALTMVCCIVLGMGVPTTANYIIMATTCAPILINGMGMNTVVANMFVFYFGIVADITPPVALAAYAGSAIAGSKPMKTAFTATMLSIAAFIVPYIFAFNSSLLFINPVDGGSVPFMDVAMVIVTSSAGMFAISAGMIGFMLKDLTAPLRLLSLATGLMLIYPDTTTDIVGLVVLAVLIVSQVSAVKKATPSALA